VRRSGSYKDGSRPGDDAKSDEKWLEQWPQSPYPALIPTGTKAMWYAIFANDRDNSLEARLNARPAHVERLKILQSEGRLFVAGPMPAIDAADPGPAGFSGSLIVAEFDSLQKARAWAAEDPYIEAGVYRDVDVRPFLRALPA
jgi:uncharacterized protein YciI